MGEKKRRLKSGDRPVTDASAATLDALRLFRSGHGEEALALYRALLGRPVTDPDALHRLGFLAIQFGESQRAEAWLRAAASAVPEQPGYCNTLGIALRQQRRYAEAIEFFRRALEIALGQGEIWSNLGNALRDDGRFAEAAGAYRRAMQLAPDVGYHWSAFGICMRHFRPGTEFDAGFRADLVSALAHPDVSPSDLAQAAIAAVKASPATRQLIEDALGAGEAFEDPLLLRLLESAVIADVELELALTRIRRQQLQCAIGRGGSALPLAAAAAIARQCFLNEYAWFETAEETHWVESLAEALRSEPERDPVHVATLAAYRPLDTLPEIASAEPQARGPLAELFRQQVNEPAEERRLQSAIRRLAHDAGEASKAVRNHYEANPYPRWARMGRFEHARPAPEVLGELFPGRDFGRLPRSGVRILVAGCGTGRHAIQAALRFADSRVLALDLSLASLAYAARKTHEMELTNIDYCQADILALGDMNERFDVIESVGVLHHLRDPLAGWRVLRDLMAPAGVMHVGLYSELGRRHIVHGQAHAAGFGADAPSLRRLRRAVIEARNDDRLRQLTASEDFFHLSGCRDLLLHVEEHRFSPGDLASMLRALELEFLGFELPEPGIARRYRERFPDDPAMTDLSRWREFEQAEPDTFFGMYDFWVRRPS